MPSSTLDEVRASRRNMVSVACNSARKARETITNPTPREALLLDLIEGLKNSLVELENYIEGFKL